MQEWGKKYNFATVCEVQYIVKRRRVRFFKAALENSLLFFKGHILRNKGEKVGFWATWRKKAKPARPNTVGKKPPDFATQKRPLDKILRFTPLKVPRELKRSDSFGTAEKRLYINLCQIFSMRKSLGLLLVSHLWALLIAFCLIRLMVMVISCVCKE